MAKGYSVITINEIRSANSQLLGVQLGLVCLKNDIPVTDVAEFFGVSRMTVYNWFKGSEVTPSYRNSVSSLLNILSTSHSAEEALRKCIQK